MRLSINSGYRWSRASVFPGMTYQDIAIQFIDGWNTSPPHAGLMNANYMSKVIVGVTTYYHILSRTVFISFVHVS